MKKIRFLLFVMIFSILASPVFAQRLTVRLASLVPENTAWGQSINRLAAEWSRVTNGQVTVTVFHGGTAGDEAQVVALLRSNQIQAAVLTSMGLNSITPEVMALSYPFLVRNDAELTEVLRVIKPDLDARMQRNGFVTLAWARAGWVKLFSRTPLTTPDDLRRLRLASSPDEQQMIDAFRTLNYQIVPTHLSETLTALQSSRIDALYISPVFVAGNQLFGIANNMSSINVAPFMGGILMNDVTWRRIPDRFKPALMEASRRLERDIEASIANLETEAVNTMLRYGLRINQLTPAQSQVWYDDTARFENRLVGGANPVFNREFYTRIKNILTEYRSRGR
ncbi:MAG: TRAP transporter substrate-binding protein DctP [Treponema sp.]|nr:TRAP transporter substrate-binding protein DctP [Treponema sp.]MCL2236959.1 TRAP transporter substrate-binding protein DctP [Treponema sp.]